MRYVHRVKYGQYRDREADHRAKGPLELVHCDLAVPVGPAAKDGFKYTLSFVDDFTGINFKYLLKQKSDTVEATETFLAAIALFGKVKRRFSTLVTSFSWR